jgi:hypothetical protein
MPRAALLMIAVCLLTGTRASARTRIVVHNGESIQAAIDAAPAGATIVVKPGVYQGTSAARALTITKDGIHLIGLARHNQPVILQQSGVQTHGIWVSPADSTDPLEPELPPCGMMNEQLHGFTLRGFTVQGFPGFGVYLACVDDFVIRNNAAVANDTYSIFPVRSSHGHMVGNYAAGTQNDACVYVGQDDSVNVHGNFATDCIIGFEIENSHHVRMVGNVAINNTAGMLVDIVGNREVTDISDNVIAHNIFENSNRPNTAAPGEDTSQILPGIGLILEGADNTLLTHNQFNHNNLAGMTLVSPCAVDPTFCTPPIDFDPNPDGNRVTRNTFDGNAIDVIFFPGDGQNNCFAKNTPSPLTAIGGPLPTCQ